MKNNTKQVTFRIPPAIYEALEVLAAEKGHTVSSYIRWLIWKHIDEKDITVSVFGEKPPLAKEVARAKPVTEDCISPQAKCTE